MIPYGSTLVGIYHDSLKTNIMQEFIRELLDFFDIKWIIIISIIDTKLKVVLHSLKRQILKSKQLKFNFVKALPPSLLFNSSWYTHIIITIDKNRSLIDHIKEHLVDEFNNIDQSIGLDCNNIAISKAKIYEDKDLKTDESNQIKLLQYHVNDKVQNYINKKFIVLKGYIYSHVSVFARSDNVLWDALSAIKNDLKQSLSDRIDLLQTELNELQKRLEIDDIESFNISLPRRVVIKGGKDIIVTPHLKETDDLEDIKVFGIEKKDLLIIDNEEIIKSFNIKLKNFVDYHQLSEKVIDSTPLKPLTENEYNRNIPKSINIYDTIQFKLFLLVIIISVMLYILFNKTYP